jgi:hypothetical protein
MEKLPFEEWKLQLTALIKAAGFKPNLEDDDMLFIAWDMEELSPEEAAEEYIANEKLNEDS